MNRKRSSGLWVALFLGACAAAFGYLLHLSGGRVPIGGDFAIDAVVPDSYGLTAHADVRQAGVRIGEISRTRTVGNVTVVRLSLDEDHRQVHRDATVRVRAKSVVGEAYLELDPGTSRAAVLPDGGRLPIGRADEATQIDQVLSVLDADHRVQLRRALAGIGGGLAGNGTHLNELLEASSALTGEAAPVAAVFAGERERVARTVDAFGRVMRAIGDRGASLQQLVRGIRQASSAVAARDAQLRRTFSELPSFLAQTDRTASHLAGFATRATPVVGDLRVAVRELVPAVADLRPAATDGRRLVRALGSFAKAAQPTLRELRPFSKAGQRVAAPLIAGLRQANPLLAYLAPYWREVSTVLSVMGAVNAKTDATSHILRLAPMISRSSLPGTLTPAEEQLLASLSNRLSPLTGNLDNRGTNAYPKPGEAGAMKPLTGTYPRLERDPAPRQ